MDFEHLSERVAVESDRLRAEISKDVPEAPAGVHEILERLALQMMQGASNEPEA